MVTSYIRALWVGILVAVGWSPMSVYERGGLVTPCLYRAPGCSPHVCTSLYTDSGILSILRAVDWSPHVSIYERGGLVTPCLYTRAVVWSPHVCIRARWVGHPMSVPRSGLLTPCLYEPGELVTPCLYEPGELVSPCLYTRGWLPHSYEVTRRVGHPMSTSVVGWATKHDAHTCRFGAE